MHDERYVLSIRRRLAAPACDSLSPSVMRLEPHIDQLAYEWACWVRSRRFYAPDSRVYSPLARLVHTSRTTAPSTGPNAVASARLALFHQCVLAGGEDRDRWAFEGYYLWRIKPLKQLASALRVDRTHVYRLRNQFARRAYAAYQQQLGK